MSRPISPEQYEPSWNAAAQAEAEARFEAQVMAGPIVDNANDRLWGPNGQYDGPRCTAGGCDTAVDEDGLWCEDCEDRPHPFQRDSLSANPGGLWCVCGRILEALVHTDERGDQ